MAQTDQHESPEQTVGKQVRNQGNRQSAQIRNPTERKRRNSLGGNSLRMAVDREFPGYHTAWKNDDGVDLPNAEAAGYEFVYGTEAAVTDDTTARNVDLGDKIKLRVGLKENGEPLFAYLMKIRMEYHLADLEEITDKNRQVERNIKRRFTEGEDGKFYVPKVK